MLNQIKEKLNSISPKEVGLFVGAGIVLVILIWGGTKLLNYKQDDYKPPLLPYVSIPFYVCPNTTNVGPYWLCLTKKDKHNNCTYYATKNYSVTDFPCLPRKLNNTGKIDVDVLIMEESEISSKTLFDRFGKVAQIVVVSWSFNRTVVEKLLGYFGESYFIYSIEREIIDLGKPAEIQVNVGLVHKSEI